jgi:ribosome-binding protein aMBF1 (putative translation factor)
MNPERQGSGLKEVFGQIRAEVPEFAEAEKRLGTRLVVARNVIRHRLQRGWTQARLAEEMGVRQPRIAQIESASANFRLDTLDALAEAFGVAPSSLLEGEARQDPRRRRAAEAAPVHAGG